MRYDILLAMSRKGNNTVNVSGLLYGRKVVKDIIRLAAKEIGGVAYLCGKGIRTDILGKNINMDVFLVIESGSSVPDVAYRVQENIKRTVETMTEYRTDTVNINIFGVRFPSDANEKV